MAKRTIRSVASDLAGVSDYLTAKGLLPPSPPQALLVHVKRIHRATYSLILWRFRLKRLPPHGKVYIEEIASDALQILPQSLNGYGKAVTLLIRGVVENTLRHIYFSDHPVEFEKMNRGQKWYLSVTDLLSYASTHPIFSETEKSFDAVNRLSSLYDDLSATVHGRTVNDLQMHSALRRITYTQVNGDRDVALVERCAATVNFCLAAFHVDQVRGFANEDRSTILQSMPVVARNAWRHLP